MKNPRATRHGKKRIKERMGISLRSSDRQASLALERGLYHKDMRGRLHKWVTKQALNSDQKQGSKKYVIYNRCLFVFSGDYEKLITTYDVPRHLHKLIDAQSKK